MRRWDVSTRCRLVLAERCFLSSHLCRKQSWLEKTELRSPPDDRRNEAFPRRAMEQQLMSAEEDPGFTLHPQPCAPTQPHYAASDLSRPKSKTVFSPRPLGSLPSFLGFLLKISPSARVSRMKQWHGTPQEPAQNCKHCVGSTNRTCSSVSRPSGPSGGFETPPRRSRSYHLPPNNNNDNNYKRKNLQLTMLYTENSPAIWGDKLFDYLKWFEDKKKL